MTKARKTEEQILTEVANETGVGGWTSDGYFVTGDQHNVATYIGQGNPSAFKQALSLLSQKMAEEGYETEEEANDFGPEELPFNDHFQSEHEYVVNPETGIPVLLDDYLTSGPDPYEPAQAVGEESPSPSPSPNPPPEQEEAKPTTP